MADISIQTTPRDSYRIKDCCAKVLFWGGLFNSSFGDVQEPLSLRRFRESLFATEFHWLPNGLQNPFPARSLERLERQRHALEAEVEVKFSPCSPQFWCMLHRFCANSGEFCHDNTKARADESGNPIPLHF